MAYPLSTKKRIRQAKKRNLRNRHFKSMMKTWIRRVEEAPSKDEALKLFPQAISVIDKVAQKGIIHKNTAANKKSSLANHVNAL
ncbi:MAG: 30S ribosomal protein S20 [Candidatus Marinimicrobia bacterium]|jgi:small subunit ribosomal protein S20|nr:30S ribosomal protein S20 [Candidatus Neomarinimicrobiota bacterium]MDD4961536.1 30S ribosomal protein S20 [Candidatus Neomarinimicrobiota bacterium]MDD5709783.1 30S ribosomal protein S20 [Candidatus Neomarinimicrobiota bacterium]MDX9777498.1 30S ribosomal protein S20 [bacterium]